MPLANDNARTNRSEPDENWHRNGARQVLGLASQEFGSRWTTKDKLNSNQQKDDAPNVLSAGQGFDLADFWCPVDLVEMRLTRRSDVRRRR